jgi:hypothetical protein
MNQESQNEELNRVNLFYSDARIQLESMYSRFYLKRDLNQEITLYRVSYVETKKKNIYRETKAKDKVFQTAVNLTAMVNLGDAEHEYLSEGGIRREDVGTVVVGVFLDELKEKNIEINAGDYFKYNPDGERFRYFEITNPNYVNYSTGQTLAGIKPLYKRFTARPAREDEIELFN